MEQFDLLRLVVAAPERVGLQYFVTGSTVTSFYGEPRFTNDIDIVECFREGGSEKHLRDVAGVLKTSQDFIDKAYIERWAAALNLQDIWQRLKDRLHLA